jgi:hypothetical protein
MIHRIDRVNPDVDDRVIKPNEARDAINLRFGASTEDTNLSGGTLILGNEELPFVPPTGTNRVVGVYSDLESRNVYFALYNSGGDHGLYRINGATDLVEPILMGSWLNFEGRDEYNVSIAVIDGKLYFTDNVNPPRMVNIEKGVRTQKGDGDDVYPTPVEDWHYTQIKRPPGEALVVSPVLSLDQRSATIQNKTQTETGLQYSYYYVYDNFEESRLGPFTALNWATENVTITIPESEWNAYGRVSSMIRAIVIVIRNGNDGVWRELQYQKNEGSVREWTFSNVLTAIKNTVASDITDARFDSVPLLSVTNEVAQNRVNHGNYVLDYEYDDKIKIEAEIDSLEDVYITSSARIRTLMEREGNTLGYNSFVPWGRYAVGVEYVDKFGRTYPITNTVEVVAPYLSQSVRTANVQQTSDYSELNPVPLYSSGNLGNNVTIPEYNQGINARNLNNPSAYKSGYNTICKYKITITPNQIPDWVDKINIVRSKAKNIIAMNQSIGQIFMWYENEERQPRFFAMVNKAWYPYYIPPDSRNTNLNTIWHEAENDKKYTFRGYVIFYAGSEPFVQQDNQYVTISQIYSTNSNANTNGWTNIPSQEDALLYMPWLKFPVHLIDGNFIYIKAESQVLRHPSIPTTAPEQINLTPYSIFSGVYSGSFDQNDLRKPENFYSLFYNFTLTTEVNIDDQTVFATEQTYTRGEFVSELNAYSGVVEGYIKGDGSMCRAKKIYPNTTKKLNLYTLPRIGTGRIPTIDPDQPIRRDRLEWYGTFISMSPRDIYAQTWNQDIGQENVTDYKDVRNRRLNSSICFSLPIVQGTQVNGLNKFNSLDFRLAPAENGPITALVTTNATQREPGILLAIGTYGVSSFYYDAIQLTNVDGSNNVTTTDSYLASQRPLLGQYGSSRPMSVTKTPLGTVYWWSDVVNDLIRYTNAGLERLGLTYSFGNFLRRTYNDNSLLITWYDQMTDEIHLLGKEKNTAVFSERYKTFQGQREYFQAIKEDILLYPERATGLPTKQYYFIEGRIYVSDVEAQGVANNFLFGGFKNPSLTIVTNEAPASVKQWNQIKVFGAKPTGVELSCPADSGGVPLESALSPSYFIERKGDYEAAIRRATNTTGGLLAGKIMESRIIYSKFAFDANTFVKLNFVEVKGNNSIVQ